MQPSSVLITFRAVWAIQLAAELTGWALAPDARRTHPVTSVAYETRITSVYSNDFKPQKIINRTVLCVSHTESCCLFCVTGVCPSYNPLLHLTLYNSEAITVPRRIIGSWYTGRWWVGCYIWYSKEGTGRGRSPLRPLLAVPITAHPSTVSVPITVLLYNGPLLCGFNVSIKCYTWLGYTCTCG